MASLGRGGFLALAVIFHLVYIFSIFDIYFVSPIVHGMRSFGVEHPAPAKRLVLFVGDGLRADKAFQSFPNPTPKEPTADDLVPRPLAPFLRSRILEHGTFGVSHTRVPTESRPGHVALIAGLYEDVSAVTTGWKLNPVNFDSIFNRSRHTWSWGSPDILPMFSEGAVPGRVDADQYEAEAEDFTQDATALDIWVFDKVKAMFHEAKTNATLNTMLRQDKNVLFLHLLGLDSTGHGFRPYSKEYLHNIKVVDEGVSEIYQLIQDFYGDDDTAYVFTADHGMSDWGSHGDGHPDNTRTPLITWGAGLAKPVITTDGVAPGHADNFSYDWGLQHVQRHDVEQADVAALMAYLVGLDFPVNSVGELPLSYLDATIEQKAHAALANARGVLEMYAVKEAEKQRTELRYQPFVAFSGEGQSVADRVQRIEDIISSGQYDQSIVMSKELLHDGLKGLRYLQTYDWFFLRVLITFGYLGWMAYATTTVIDVHVLHGSSAGERTSISLVVFTSILVLLYSSFLISESPLQYYAYAFFPVFFWEEVYARRNGLFAGLKVLFGNADGAKSYIAAGLEALIFLGVLEALVQSYFQRIIFTICYIIGAFWPLVYGLDFLSANISLIGPWMIGCLSLSTFTLLPVIKTEDANTITYGGILMLGAGLIYLFFEQSITAKSRSGRSDSKTSSLSRAIMGCQIGVVILSIIVTRSSVASMQARKGLPFGNQIVGWLCLLSSLVLPFVHRIAPNNHYLHRLMVIFLTFSPSFIILTISYEGLFYCTFCATLLIWVRLEHAIYLHTTDSNSTTISQPPSRASTITSTTAPNSDLIAISESASSDVASSRTTRTLTTSDFRISLFFLFFLQSAFFSTGNIASVSSFSLESVLRLIPVFDPFSQGALLILKILIPFACISAALGILNRRLGLASSALFMVVMAVGDVLVLNFFWMVRDEGSWLDIGTTISHFVIGSLLCVFVASLEVVSEMLIAGVDVTETVVDGVKGEQEVFNVTKSANGSASSMTTAGKGQRPVID
ncbi:Glycosyl phosphatidyl inositol anchor synthesis [Neophaeococcomyces mojaviensis]|uniref:Glycosyl phosphatidyl inositol anchor synthesis n=1 Tax=Neophaeococcomyces mojaviensis TaxID=3383035 RepID=A0ACC3AKJ6_9EURO|nr:Glycosyl phosphatidyl inositol anchor synthesis [Knufia sp. JES_112]